MKKIPSLSFQDFGDVYCERSEQTHPGLRTILRGQREQFKPEGWMLLECAMLDSSKLGTLTILPFGGSASFPSVPDHSVSPRGLCSDMSVVIAVLPVEALEFDTEPIEKSMTRIVSSQVNEIWQGTSEESYERQIAMEAYCQDRAELTGAQVVLYLARESGSRTFSPIGKKRRSYIR